jgi:hypothetical protein
MGCVEHYSGWGGINKAREDAEEAQNKTENRSQVAGAHDMFKQLASCAVLMPEVRQAGKRASRKVVMVYGMVAPVSCSMPLVLYGTLQDSDTTILLG